MKKQTKKYNVEPFRNQEDIEDMKESLRKWCSERDRFLFVFGINTGLRISDIVGLKVKDVRNKKYVTIIEKKTGKPKKFPINKYLEKEINAYIKDMQEDAFLFPSRRRDGRGHISEVQAYRRLVFAGDLIDKHDVGTHTLRKTFGFHYYKKTKDIATLMQIFNHSSPVITKRYIGITQDEIDESLKNFYL